MSTPQPIIYAGFSHVSYAGDPIDLGHGLVLQSTYAHLFAVNMMAFSRAPLGGPHPPPWRAAQGGFGYDVEVELSVPAQGALPGRLPPKEVIWLIAALLRLSYYPYLAVPVVSDTQFHLAPVSSRAPTLEPFEIEPRIIQSAEGKVNDLSPEKLAWIKDVWPRTAELMLSHPTLKLALRAADACTVQGRPASALLTVWGALEEIFAPARAELRFRVSANIAAYLEPAGAKRLEMFKAVAKLYDARSKAAHTAQDAGPDALVASFVLLRNALIRMVDEGVVPTQAALETRLFCGDVT